MELAPPLLMSHVETCQEHTLPCEIPFRVLQLDSCCVEIVLFLKANPHLSLPLYLLEALFDSSPSVLNSFLSSSSSFSTTLFYQLPSPSLLSFSLWPSPSPPPLSPLSSPPFSSPSFSVATLLFSPMADLLRIPVCGRGWREGLIR